MRLVKAVFLGWLIMTIFALGALWVIVDLAAGYPSFQREAAVLLKPLGVGIWIVTAWIIYDHKPKAKGLRDQSHSTNNTWRTPFPMAKRLLLLIGGLAGMILLYVNFGNRGTYEDCVLKNMPTPSTDVATVLVLQEVRDACKSKYATR